MNKKVLLPLLVLSVPVVLIIVFFAQYINTSHEGRVKTFNQLIGSYTLDISKTKLGNYKDSNLYRKLSITFNPDSTFKMNMQVPFMYDSSGRWRAGNTSEWCWMFFRKFGYTDKMYSETNPSGSQFTRPYVENSDTFFLINGATPRDNEKTISDIYFKKTRPK